MHDDDRVMTALRQNVQAVLPDVDPALVQPGRSLADLGCNSIDRMDVVTMTMAELGVSVPVGEFTDVRDIGSLARLLREHVT